MRCATHPEVETALRYGKCDKPICPRCLVQTPVGARCPQCARVRKLPTFRISAKHLLIAAVTGLVTAVICGVIWGFIGSLLNFFYLNLLLAAGAGYIIGEVISLAVNRKRGLPLVIIAGFAVATSYLVSIFSPWGYSFASLHILRLVMDLIAVALGIYIAYTRLH